MSDRRYYDSAGRLTSVSKNGVITSSFVYDLNSNRVSGIQDGQPFTATYDDQDRMLAYDLGSEDQKQFTYNANGELTQIVQGSLTTTFVPDTLGRLKSVTLPTSDVVSYKLDWDGRRSVKAINGTSVKRSIFETKFQLAGELDSANNFTEYVSATHVNSSDYFKKNGEHYRIIKDHLGSPRLVIKASDATVLQRMDYNEWGKVILDTNPGVQPFGFAGGMYDHDTKLVKFGARDYDASIGRWMSKDPIGFGGGDTNLYGYVLNDPVSLIDVNGLEPSLETRDPNLMNQSFLTQADFLENYIKMRQANTIGADKYYHCMANCQAASRGANGARTAELISDTREWVDENLKGDSLSECQADQRANQAGRNAGQNGQSCSQACSGFGPSGR